MPGGIGDNRVSGRQPGPHCLGQGTGLACQTQAQGPNGQLRLGNPSGQRARAGKAGSAHRPQGNAGQTGLSFDGAKRRLNRRRGTPARKER